MLVEHDGAAQLAFGHAVAFKFVKREVHAVSLDVFADVAQDVRELHENPP